MKLVLNENAFKGLLTEMVKEVLLEDNNKEFFERIVQEYLQHFEVTVGNLPNSSRDELKGYINNGLKKAYYLSKNKGYTQSPENFIYLIQNNLLSQLKFNKRGLIYVERALKFNEEQSLIKKIKNDSNIFDDEYEEEYDDYIVDEYDEEEYDEYSSVGECWSFKPKNAISYCNRGFGCNIHDVILHGYIHPKDVDWVRTMYLNVWDMSYETEIRTAQNSYVEITDVTVNEEKFHLNKSYLVTSEPNKYTDNFFGNDNKYYDEVSNNIFQEKQYSVNDKINVENLLKQGVPLKNIFQYVNEIYYPYVEISIDKKKWTILNVETNRVLLGDINNHNTWCDRIKSIGQGYYIFIKNNKSTIYNVSEERFVITNKINQPIWLDKIEDINEDSCHIFYKYKENYFIYDTENVIYGDINNPNTWCDEIRYVGGYYSFIININNKYNFISNDFNILEGKLDDINTWFDDIITFSKMKFFITKKSDKYQIRSFNNYCKLITDTLFDNFKIIDNNRRSFRKRSSDNFLKLYSQGKEYILTPIDYGLGCKIQPSDNINQ